MTYQINEIQDIEYDQYQKKKQEIMDFIQKSESNKKGSKRNKRNQSSRLLEHNGVLLDFCTYLASLLPRVQFLPQLPHLMNTIYFTTYLFQCSSQNSILFISQGLLCPTYIQLLLFLHTMITKYLLILVIIFATNSSIYQKYYDEAYSIAAAMTLDQKIGQTIQLDFYGVTGKNGTDATTASKLHLGSLLVSGNGVPDSNGNMIFLPENDEAKTISIYQNATLEKWQKLAEKFNNISMQITTNEGKTYDIRPLVATDAVHGNQHVSGSILFPHNIGLSCSHNPNNFYNTGKWTAFSVKKSGFNYAFAPTVAVSHNPHWGRYYQTMGQQDEWIYKYGKSYVEGLQGKPGFLTGVLASVKHFIGDGATMYGADEGNAHVGSFKSFISHNIQGYNGSISAEVGSVMCTYSAVNWLPVAISPMINTLLRRKMDFDGFVISDYDSFTRLKNQQEPTSLQTFNSLNDTVAQTVNSGIDMIMVSSRKVMDEYIEGYKISLKNNTITTDRLNDAVARIISVKLALGIAKVKQNSMIRPKIQLQKSQANIGETTQYEDSLQAVRQSLVLVKNTPQVIPIKASSLQYVVLVGQKIININNLAKHELFLNYDNIGMQNGGWTLRWQGFEGNTQWKGQNKAKSNASSILDALQGLKQKFQIIKPNYTTFSETTRIDIERNEYLNKLKTLKKKMNAQNTVIIAVQGQSPYAQFSGDVGIPYCANATILTGDGCLYAMGTNPYMPQKQKTNLNLQFAKFDQEVITSIKQQDKNIPLITILLAGRPMHIDKILQQSSAVLHAFLPGTSGGQGIVDALTGAYTLRPNGLSDLRNTLSFDWPKNTVNSYYIQSQLARFPVYTADGKIPKIEDPLFKVGYGLSTKA